MGRKRCGEWLLFAGVHDLMHLDQLHSLAEGEAAGALGVGPLPDRPPRGLMLARVQLLSVPAASSSTERSKVTPSRSSALRTAFMEAVVMFGSIPTPQRTSPCERTST